ncbi:MAG TPA: nitrilase-related carbon-nitrogen hydrolase, partial [Atopobiaceae bacterium]|nr:nitrilase-related carbon-nitrogen hydrolase [Atopobiaceae bacterium]
MRYGFVPAAALTPDINVADVEYNVGSCLKAISTAVNNRGRKIVVLPELCITAYTCGDLFFQEAVLAAAEDGLAYLAEQTAELDALIFVGA